MFFYFFLILINFSQLFYDGHQTMAVNLSNIVQADPPCPPSDRLLHIMIAGLDHEPERKERPVNHGIGNNLIGPGLGEIYKIYLI